MVRNFDPNNFTAGHVLRLVTPTIAVIAVLVLIGLFAPDFFWLFIVLLVAGGYVSITKLPRKDLRAIAEKERDVEVKVRRLPVIGPIAVAAWRLLGWFVVIYCAIVLILLVLASLKSILAY
jgi:hypothetical protein